MRESTTIIASDQHADSVVAAVLPPTVRVPVVQAVPADLPGLGRLVDRLARRQSAYDGSAARPGAVATPAAIAATNSRSERGSTAYTVVLVCLGNWKGRLVRDPGCLPAFVPRGPPVDQPG